MTRRDEFDCNLTNYEDGALQQEYRSHMQKKIDQLPKRYQKPAADSSGKALWEQVGEDLDSPSEERSREAGATACRLLADEGALVHDMANERETHREGWLQEPGQDQRFAREGMDGASQVLAELRKKNSRALMPDEFASLGLPERYYNTWLDYGFTKPWFDLINEDFSSPSLEVRKDTAWVAFDYSFIKKEGYEAEMDREGILEVYYNCYEKLVNEGVFHTKPQENKGAKAYFRTAFRNALSNKYTRSKKYVSHPDPIPFSALSNKEREALLTESAQDAAERNMSESILHDELLRPGYLTEREYQVYKAIRLEHWTIKELAKQYGVKPSAIRDALSRVHQKMIFRRDHCITSKLNEWDSYYGYATRDGLPFSNHAAFFVEYVKEALRPALKAAALIDGSQPFLLPLTSGIAERPGRLYLSYGHDDVWAKIADYLAAQGINPKHYKLAEYRFHNAWPMMICKQSNDFPLIPVLDEIMKHLRENNNSALPKSFDDIYDGIRLYFIWRPKENILPHSDSLPLEASTSKAPPERALTPYELYSLGLLTPDEYGEHLLDQTIKLINLLIENNMIERLPNNSASSDSV